MVMEELGLADQDDLDSSEERVAGLATSLTAWKCTPLESGGRA